MKALEISFVLEKVYYEDMTLRLKEILERTRAVLEFVVY